MKRNVSVLALVGLGLALPLMTVAEVPEKEAATVKRVPLTADQMRLRAGGEMYQSYCAVCHGQDGKGGGPAARALAMPCPDLTRLAEANDGDFPRIPTLNEILRDRDTPVHGTQEMPIWGDVFRVSDSPARVRHRAWVLMKYIESIQAVEELEDPSSNEQAEPS